MQVVDFSAHVYRGSTIPNVVHFTNEMGGLLPVEETHLL
jgi:hypothetical protein